MLTEGKIHTSSMPKNGYKNYIFFVPEDS
jgi:hypothetical protein